MNASTPKAEAWRWGVLALGVGACLTPWVTVAGALGIGLCLAVLGLAPRDKALGVWARSLIQFGVVLLGLSMNLRELARAGLMGAAFAAGTIVATFALGALVGRWLRCEDRLTALLSAGTAICGGSAIAAVGSVIGATQAQVAVAMGTVFLLNALGLYAFPLLGHALGLSQEQFGAWAAVAIHDVSSVAGAAATFDHRYFPGAAFPDQAMQTATAVKLARTLWIVPVALACAWWFTRRSASAAGAGTHQRGRLKAPVPWFVLWFVVAAAVGTYVPAVEPIIRPAAAGAKTLMAIALLLIGCGLSLSAIAAVGWRAITLGVSLWVFISALALVVVRWTLG
jgi:uncharacterized integral membrane protein (TIGR00698 family)